MTPSDPSPVCVAALYQFAPLSDYAERAQPLRALCGERGIRGTLLLAKEGVNGTIAGSVQAIEQVVAHIRAFPGCAELDVKYSHAAEMPFHRMKVRLKREIVTMGQPDIDPLSDVGAYVDPDEWNRLIADPDTIVIDTRNDYEIAIGTFAGAINPQTSSFREFPEWFRNHRQELLGEGGAKKVAMFCTGGIRCEKSTAFLKSEGVEAVFHLKGGILRYLEEVDVADSLWDGECFVFDQRVSVGHGLVPGDHVLCHACRVPVTPEQRQSPLFEEGVSCPACHDTRTDEQRMRYRERHRQEALAAARGAAHIGAVQEKGECSPMNGPLFD